VESNFCDASGSADFHTGSAGGGQANKDGYRQQGVINRCPKSFCERDTPHGNDMAQSIVKLSAMQGSTGLPDWFAVKRTVRHTGCCDPWPGHLLDRAPMAQRRGFRDSHTGSAASPPTTPAR